MPSDLALLRVSRSNKFTSSAITIVIKINDITVGHLGRGQTKEIPTPTGYCVIQFSGHWGGYSFIGDPIIVPDLSKGDEIVVQADVVGFMSPGLDIEWNVNRAFSET